MSKSSSLTMAFDPDTALIMEAYETADDIGKVLRAHLAIELQMEQLIGVATKAQVDRRTGYWGKVNLMRAMSVPEKVCVACHELNELRNQFAHNSKATIENTKSVSDKFLGAVEVLFPKLSESHGTFVKKKPGVEHKFKYAEATQGQRIVVAASFLSAIIGALPKMYGFGKPSTLAKLSGIDLE